MNNTKEQMDAIKDIRNMMERSSWDCRPLGGSTWDRSIGQLDLVFSMFYTDCFCTQNTKSEKCN